MRAIGNAENEQSEKRRGRKKKPVEEKLRKTVHVGLTDTDYETLAEISEHSGIGEAAEARRFILRGIHENKSFNQVIAFLKANGNIPENYAKLGQEGRIRTEEEAYSKFVSELIAEKLEKSILESSSEKLARDAKEITEIKKQLEKKKACAARRVELLAELTELE